MKAARVFLLVVCFLVCPLLFFTNLTRNPYVTQISLLNIALLLLGALALAGRAWGGEEPLGQRLRTAVSWPWAGWTLACAISWLVAYLGHAAFFRSSMEWEGLRKFLFLLANAAIPFHLAVLCRGRGEEGPEPSIGAWAGFALIWGILWTAYPQMRGASGGAGDVWGLVWDGYGAFLWAGGLVAACWLCRRARWSDFMHLAFAAGFLASVYGMLQYFGMEFLWPNVLNPYSGRSVSTFGNPNFLSSFNATLLPLALFHFARSRGGARLAYGALVLALEGALLCSLTRSSWIGAATGAAVLAFSAELRRQLKQDPRPFGLLFGAGLAMALLWPQSSIIRGEYTPIVIARLSEGARSLGDAHYSSWYQRVLIWSCAWMMGAENPATGKGWGLFELFYPFYQGHFLTLFDVFRGMRTHANNAHNEVLEIWAQTGILGLGAYLWLWTAFWRSARERFRAGGDALGAACAAAAAAMLADNLLNVSIHFAVPAFLFWWLAGSAVSGSERSSAPLGKALGTRAVAVVDPPRPVVRWSLTFAAVFLASLSWYWVKTWNRETRYFAGFKLLRQNNGPAAIRQLELSRAWGPPEVNSIYELGNAYARAERHGEADEAYRAALEANAGYDEIYFNVGVLRATRLGLLDSAVDYFRAAAWINPLSPEVYNSLGNLYLQDPKRWGEPARALLARAVRFYPDNATHWNNLGYLLTLSGDLEGAERAYAAALELDPSMAIAERNLAALAAQGKRPKPAILSAIADMRELDRRVGARDFSDATLALSARLALRLPRLAKMHFLHGSLLLARGRAAEALVPLERAALLKPSGVGLVNLAEAYLALGRPSEAGERLRAALALEPGHPQASARLKQLFPGAP